MVHLSIFPMTSFPFLRNLSVIFGQDSTDDAIQDMLLFSCVCPLKTVASLLKAKNGFQLLQDPLLEVATTEVVAGDKPRHDVWVVQIHSVWPFDVLE